MRKVSLVGTLAVAVVGSSMIAMQSDAAVLRYRLSGDWTEITNGTTPGWGPNAGGAGTALPGATDDARVNFGNNLVTVTTVVPTVARVQIGVDESGNVQVNDGGVSSTSGNYFVGNNNALATGTLTVNSGGTVNVGSILFSGSASSAGVIALNSGGTITSANHLFWGASVGGTTLATINGTLTQTGGILGLGSTNPGADTATGGTATVSIGDGGLLAINNISSGNLGSIQLGSSITISGSGELTIPNTIDGNFVAVLQNYADNGRILGVGDLEIDTTRNPGFTTAYVIPEPASMMLIGAGVIGMMARRRRA